MYLCDFLCIHPLNDGNGPKNRLLTTLLLYQSGCLVGKYISLEHKIEKTKEVCYEVLRTVSIGWHEGTNDYTPCIKYFLGIVLNSYRDLKVRLGSLDQRSASYDLAKKVVDTTLGVFTKTAVLGQCPTTGSSSVEAALKKLVEEGYIHRQGKGSGTAYVRSFGEHKSPNRDPLLNE